MVFIRTSAPATGGTTGAIPGIGIPGIGYPGGIPGINGGKPGRGGNIIGGTIGGNPESVITKLEE